MTREMVLTSLRSLCIVAFMIVLGIVFYTTKPRIIVYGKPAEIDFSLYDSESNIDKLFSDCIALHTGSTTVYEKGKYIESSGDNLLVYNEGKLFCSSEYINKVFNASYSGNKVSIEKLKEDGYKVFSYENRMCIVGKNDFKVSEFDNLYTLEALSLRLKKSALEDIQNAFIDLPYLISNGRNNAVYYSEPNLNLGIQTEIYANQLASESKRPMIVAGEGEYKDNRTLVRVFNDQQACITQFLAFGPNVKGGVQVKALSTKGGEVLIAATPYNDRNINGRRVRIFDVTGNLYMEIIPYREAPFIIATGYFLGNINEEQLLVTEMYPDKKIVIDVYSVSEGKLIKTIKFSIKENSRVQTEVIRDNKGNSSLLLFFKESGHVYKADLSESKISKINIDLPEGANGVYPGENANEYIVTTDEDIFSYMYKVAEDTNTKLNVGWRENRFYSTLAEENPDGYVDHGGFNHRRTDLASEILGKLTKTEVVENVFNNAVYTDWQSLMSQNEIDRYHSGYEMWEPCFTHRWNRISQTITISNIKDENDLPKYNSIGKDNMGSDYLELDSSFLIGTYADGILPMSKLRIYPLRSFLKDLSKEFKTDPEKLIALSPVHEHEINIRDSIGDYHPKMIEGFRSYLLNLYGSLEKINKKFGTNFGSVEEIDPPRDTDRGQWDKYGKSEYFDEWSLYNRFIVNKRIIEAYREAMLAGFPPESITAHQIPEGDAVAGFLGEANTRLSPIDVVMSSGTSFGGTRYGYWFAQKNNWLINARLAGHKNITVGEYSSLQYDDMATYAQLEYLFNNGVKMTHVLVPYPSNEAMYLLVRGSEKYAIDKLQKNNNPRPGNTGGTTGVTTIKENDSSYSIVVLGTGNDQNGLLKSINPDGTWEGSVYLVPFHSKVEVEKVSFSGFGSNEYTTKRINKIHHGDQIEVTFNGKGNGRIKVYATYDGVVIENSVVTFNSTKELNTFRYVFSNQLSLTDDIKIVVEREGDCKISKLSCTVQRECVSRKYFGEFLSAEHKGGISYDILSRDMLG